MLVCAAFLLGAETAASAQELAGKSMRIVVPFPAGGTADVIARLVSQHAGQNGGYKIIVENRPGAGTIIGTDLVARSPADGTTMLIMSNSFVINGIVRANLPYNPMTSFEPVCMLIDSPQVLAVNEASPYKTLKEFVDAAKAKPG